MDKFIYELYEHKRYIEQMKDILKYTTAQKVDLLINRKTLRFLTKNVHLLMKTHDFT